MDPISPPDARDRETPRLPLLTRATFAREMRAWSLLAIAMGAIEGGVTGVIAKDVFAGVVARGPLNFIVALISGAGMYANLFSFAWTAIGHGRDKIRLLVRLQILSVGSLFLIALAPVSPLGLLIFVLGACGGRALWVGVLTIRAPVWRANYPRHARARTAGGFVVADAILVGLTALAIGWVIETHPAGFRIVLPCAAAAGLLGAFFYRRVRVQKHQELLRAERSSPGTSFRGLLAEFIQILRTDRLFARYLLCMFVFGGGNLMMLAPLIAVMSDTLLMPEREQLLITTALPMLFLPVGVPFWARLLDRSHVIAFRAVHAWSYVTASAILTVGAILGSAPVLWVGAAGWGFAHAGGQLGWNLGHNDFAPAGRASQYLGLHITLTGVRGLTVPLISMTAYQLAESVAPGAGRYALVVPLAFTVAGAIGFVLLNRWARGRGLA